MVLIKKKVKIKSNEFTLLISTVFRIIFLILAKIGDFVIYLSEKALFSLQRGLKFFFEIIETIIRFGNISRIYFQAHQVKIKLPPVPHLRLPQIKLKLPMVRFPKIRFKLWLPKSFVGFIIGIFFTLVFVFIPYNLYLFVKFLPNPRLLTHRFIPVTTQIFDRNDNLLYEIHGDEDRKPISLKEIPLFIKHATIAIEDKNFYQHNGFSLTGIIRAARETYVNKNIQGGSTITQQLVKNSLLTPEISLLRKIREITLAYWTERIYSKDQILEMYLNQVPYGGTAWGIEAASQRYFGKGVNQLNLAEAAFLAGLPAAPSLYSPYGAHPELSYVRQREVLRRMVEDGYVTQEQANIAQSVNLAIKQPLDNIKAPHFVMYLRELLAKKYGTRLIDQGGLRIKTTLDLLLQEKTQEIVSSNIAALKNLNVGNGAAIITNPKNGDILTMVGSKDYFNQEEDGNVNVTLAPRQPGSSIKAVTYAAALENGLTAASLIDDTPVSFTNPGQPSYTPINYDQRFHGILTVRQAFANSYNVPAVKILNKIGLGTMIEIGERMGITTWEDKSRFGLSLTLGGGEVTMFDMAQVYGVLANHGEKIDLSPILEVKDYTGRVYYKKETTNAKQIISTEIAFIISNILADNSARTPAFGPNSSLQIPGKTVSVKTGTTNEKRDNWTIGYTPSYVVVVWVGNNDNTPMNQLLTSGVTGAAPIWNQIMTEILKNKVDESFQPPQNIVNLTCFGRREYFVRGTEPKNGCGFFPSPRPSNSN